MEKEIRVPAPSLFADAAPEFDGEVRAKQYKKLNPSPLKTKFLFSPFSVLHADSGEWKERKRAWIEKIGLRGERGRDSDAVQDNGPGLSAAERALEPGGGGGPNSAWLGRKKADASPGGGGPNSVRRRAVNDLGKCFGSGNPGDLSAEMKDKPGTPEAEKSVAGTSIFDPVLTELLYRWYGKPGGSVLDPFAGGSTRGIVAAYYGMAYTGIEIRPGQVEANRENAKLCQAKVLDQFHKQIEEPNWIVGDSAQLEEILTVEDAFAGERRMFDFLIACPPYYDLEVYSCSNADGSSKQTYEEFLVWYKGIFRQAVERLAKNRFAGIVVGDIRNHGHLGTYRNLVFDTNAIFQELGLFPYGRLILETAKGSLPVRIGGQFPEYRKPGASHQHVLLFWHGDEDKKAIPAALGTLGEDDYVIPEDENA